jgi:hypothetical protein
LTKQRTPEEMREYQRTRRAQKEVVIPPVGTVVPHPGVEGLFVVAPGVKKVHRDDRGEVLEHRLARQRTGKPMSNPFDDGLPDTPQLIQALTQGQRDSILARMAKS